MEGKTPPVRDRVKPCPFTNNMNFKKGSAHLRRLILSMQTPQSRAIGILNKHPFENEDGLQNEDDLNMKITFS